MLRTVPVIILLFLLVSLSLPATACTIVSAVDERGQVWTMNNEDGPPRVANYISVFPKTDSTLYGYYTLSYLSGKIGEGSGAQGGMNEAGLTFDFNAIDRVEDFDPTTRQAFREGNDAIFRHLMSTMHSVDEVLDFFATYWFVDGFTSAQLHVADRSGKFALISASGVFVAEAGRPLVSTNYDICGGQDGSSCWRYPVATEILAEREVGLATMLQIALATRQKETLTMYSNVQNLSTGDVWIMSYHDPDRIARVNIADLLSRGRHSYALHDLAALEGQDPKGDRRLVEASRTQLPVDSLLGTYYNYYSDNIVIELDSVGLKVSYSNGAVDLFAVRSPGVYAWVEGSDVIVFERATVNGKFLLHLYMDEEWALTAQRQELPDGEKG